MHNVKVKEDTDDLKGYFIAKFHHCLRKIKFYMVVFCCVYRIMKDITVEKWHCLILFLELE